MKFGGTSVADIDRIRHVATLVKREVERGNKVAVVVSAMAGETNKLVAWTNDAARPDAAGLAALPDQREYDVVVAAGEQVTAGLLAITLNAMGIKARSWLGWQVPINTSAVHGSARIEGVPATDMQAAIENGEVAVVAGFQGVAPGTRISSADQVLDRGDLVNVEVTEVDTDRGRIGLKLVAKIEDGVEVSPETIGDRYKAFYRAQNFEVPAFFTYGARHLISRNQSRRAGPVFDNEACAGQAFIQLAGDQTRHDVIGPARREANHKAHLAQRKILRHGGCAGE
jgi:hypothetical protein